MVFPPDQSARPLGSVLPFYKRQHGHSVPVRKAITRSKQTVRVRYPSIKARRMIDCESALEGLAALYIDLSTPVLTFRAQPFTVKLLIDGETKRYTPDFEVKLLDGRILIVEVKPFHRCTVVDTHERLIAADRYFSQSEYEYIVLTDVDLKPKVKEENLRLLRYYARITVDHKTRFSIRQHVAEQGIVSIGNLEALGFSVATVYSLIVNHALSTDLTTQLSANSPIYLPEENDHEKCLFEGRSALELR